MSCIMLTGIDYFHSFYISRMFSLLGLKCKTALAKKNMEMRFGMWSVRSLYGAGALGDK